MKRFAFALLLMASALPAMGAGVFNGSTSDISATVASTALNYPVLMTAWVKPANATANLTVLAASDNGAGGSLDALVLAARGDQSGDPFWATATAAGSSSTAATATGLTTNGWQFVAALFTSASSRQVKNGTGAWSAPEVTTRNVGNITKWSIGSLWNNGAGTAFNGKIYDVGVWSGVDTDLVDVAVAQLAVGMSPMRSSSIIRDDLLFYQQLNEGVNEANRDPDDLNQDGNLEPRSHFVGAEMTATNVTFDNDRSSARSPLPLSLSGGQSFPWPKSDGPIPLGRLVKIESGTLALADADDANAIGCVKVNHSPYALGRLQEVASMNGSVRVEVAAGVTFDLGEVAFQAAAGKISDSGTIRVGVAGEAGTGGQIIHVNTSWTQ